MLENTPHLDDDFYMGRDIDEINNALTAHLSTEAVDYWLAQPRRAMCAVCMMVWRGDNTLRQAVARAEAWSRGEAAT